MNLMYLTADQIGTETGGGLVTHHESEALKELGPCEIYSQKDLLHKLVNVNDPWCWDDTFSMGIELALKNTRDKGQIPSGVGNLCHIYAGTFSKTIRLLKEQGVKTSVTCAAHDIAVSRREHAKLHIPYDYPHMVEPELWARYVRGYLEADLLIVPSTYSKNIMVGYGADPDRIKVIPHGCNIPDTPIKPLPDRFRAGYLGAVGPDKGIIYLLLAWKQLGYTDATLVLAGKHSDSAMIQFMCNYLSLEYTTGKEISNSQVHLLGWMDKVSDFYDNISLYVQPSTSEGFGCEITEAMAHGRPVIASNGAGGSECVPVAWRVPACEPEMLATKIDDARGVITIHQNETNWCNLWWEDSKRYTWDKIREQYKSAWKELMK